VAIAAGNNACLLDLETASLTQVLPGRIVEAPAWVDDADSLLVLEERKGAPNNLTGLREAVRTIPSVGFDSQKKRTFVPLLVDVTSGAVHELTAEGFFVSYGLTNVDKMPNRVRSVFSRLLE